ncbi:HTH domain-containing protein [Nakamurella antarctica]|uniref:HTH domain-containing protein n=1 Tax=Nakamurella antarctica TaxID=1902245 RepID=A0A3G8ZJH4_9ACTN|nr:HTH domain-containing protein [Nakamurella antarctica]
MIAAAASRDNHLVLRRVERHQQLVEILHRRGDRVSFRELSDWFGVSRRTIARDVQRLRHSGVPIDVRAGRRGGASLPRLIHRANIWFDIAELTALMSSLSALGPTASESAASAMHKLVTALNPDRGDLAE